MARMTPQLMCTQSRIEQLGGLLADRLDAGDILCLHGPLGAGKSTLARAIISAMCREADDIPSPTFTLVQPYLAQPGFEVWHLDLYRLEAASEVLALGIEEAFYEACCLIEWPERITDLLPEKAMHLYLDFGTDTDSRILSLTDGGQMPGHSDTKLAAALAELAE